MPLAVDDTVNNWSNDKLAVGDWFSYIGSFNVKRSTRKDAIVPVLPKLARDAIVEDTQNGEVYDTEEKVSRSELVQTLKNGEDKVMTANFRKQVDVDYVSNILSSIDSKQLKSAKTLKELSNQLTKGQELEMTFRLYDPENIFGRSKVIDMRAPSNKNIRQIDHRTIESLITDNTKYVVKN